MKKRFFRTGCEKSIHNYVLISKMIKFLRIKNSKTIFILDLFTILSILFINIFSTRTLEHDMCTRIVTKYLFITHF